MGTLYYAVNVEAKTAFALGKNSFYGVNENADTMSLADRVHREYADNPNFTRADTDAIAAALQAYVPFVVISESQVEEELYCDFLITGSRFGQADSEVGKRLWDRYEARRQPHDWLPIRNALEAAYSGLGRRRPETSVSTSDWNLACALHEYMLDKSPYGVTKCAHCASSMRWSNAFRCFDCKAALCERCAPVHFGAGHEARAASAHATWNPPVGLNRRAAAPMDWLGKQLAEHPSAVKSIRLSPTLWNLLVDDPVFQSVIEPLNQLTDDPITEALPVGKLFGSDLSISLTLYTKIPAFEDGPPKIAFPAQVWFDGQEPLTFQD